MSTSQQGLFTTDRRDNWWFGPLLTATILGTFGLYSTWAAWVGANFEWGPYLSPFYSPLFRINGLPFSPAFLILWAPLGFRATCYYYRKAYYRAFFWDPPACAVGEARGHGYTGETKFPFIIQNLHRYFFYLAALFLVVLWYDVVKACIWDGHFGVGVGTLVMAANTTLLTSYTFGCHSCRHAIGGNLDGFSEAPCGKLRHKIWQRVTFFNQRHMLFAWCSLISVAMADLYIRLCAMGIIHDVRLF